MKNAKSASSAVHSRDTRRTFAGPNIRPNDRKSPASRDTAHRVTLPKYTTDPGYATRDTRAHRPARHYAFSAAHVTIPDQKDDVWNQINALLHGTRNPFKKENLETALNDLFDYVDEHEALPSNLKVTAIRSLREELRLANNRLNSLRSNFYRHGSPHSRVHFARRTTNHSGTGSKPSPISSQGSGEVPNVVEKRLMP